MTKLSRSVLTALVVGVLGLCGGTARANDGPVPDIYELLQQGEGVVVTLSLADAGEPGIGDPISLRRETDEGEVDLFTDQAFGVLDAVESFGDCTGTEDLEWCAQNPDNCGDCDGDEVLECVLWNPETEDEGDCYNFNLIEVLDECVPPGMATYIVYETMYSMDVDYDSASINVEDVGQECDPGSDSDVDSDVDSDSDADSDSDSDSDSDADSGGGDDGGCSVVGAGAGFSVGVLGSLLLSLG